MAKKKHKVRKEIIKRRKNFTPTLLIILFLWLLFFAIFFFLDPVTTGAIWLFLITLYLALIFTLSLLLANTRRGLILSTATIIYLSIAYYGQGNILNFLLILGITLAFEIYFYKKA